jgi:hypothetical protein
MELRFLDYYSVSVSLSLSFSRRRIRPVLDILEANSNIVRDLNIRFDNDILEAASSQRNMEPNPDDATLMYIKLLDRVRDRLAI